MTNQAKETPNLSGILLLLCVLHPSCPPEFSSVMGKVVLLTQNSLMSAQILMSPPFLCTTMSGDTHRVGPSTFSVTSIPSKAAIFLKSFSFPKHLNMLCTPALMTLRIWKHPRDGLHWCSTWHQCVRFQRQLYFCNVHNQNVLYRLNEESLHDQRRIWPISI